MTESQADTIILLMILICGLLAVIIGIILEASLNKNKK